MAYPWSKYPTHVTMRFDRGISRIQFLPAYRERRRIVLVNSSSLALGTRDCMAEVYQDAEAW
jgi:hypothetical protein